VDGGNGLGLANSVGIFIDSSGSDRYERKLKTSMGHANPGRQSGSIGIFLDMGGDDSYANEHQSNNSTWVSGVYGIGRDKENEINEFQSEKVTNEDNPLENEVNLHKIDIKELFQRASEWEVGNAIERVREARKVLLEREPEAVTYITEHKIMTKSGLELRAITEFLKGSTQMQERLPELLNHEHFRAVGNAIYLIGEIKDESFIETFEQMLSENRYVNGILSALGKFANDKSIDILETYIDSENVYRRVTVARSLKEINTERSIHLLLTMKDDDCFLIKSMIELLQ
jgi:hypothetical protein